MFCSKYYRSHDVLTLADSKEEKLLTLMFNFLLSIFFLVVMFVASSILLSF